MTFCGTGFPLTAAVVSPHHKLIHIYILVTNEYHYRVVSTCFT
jgi:hypothetical protein